MRWLSVFRRRDLLKKRHVYLDHQKQLPGFDKGDLRQAPRLLTNTPKNTSSQKKILIAPDSLHWKKRWPITYWEKLLYMILSHKDLHHCTIVGDNNVFPQDFIEALKDFAPERVENLLGKTRVEQLADVANSHDVTVCGNSAWLHISEAVGTPVVTLAGPIVEGFGFSPWMEKSRELSIDLSCRPCSKHGQGMCLLRGEDFHSCMRKIEPEKVFMNMEKVLY